MPVSILMSILTSRCSLMCPNLIFSANIQEFIAGICCGLSVFAYTYVFPECSYVHYGTSFHRERKKFTKIIWQVNSLNFKLGYVCSYNPDTIPQLVLAVVSLVAVVNNIIVTVVLLGNNSKSAQNPQQLASTWAVINSHAPATYDG